MMKGVMQPVVGLDISKGSSVFQAFFGRNEPFGKSENVIHGEEGFQRINEVLSRLREHTGVEPVIVLEATGHYHRGIVAFFILKEINHFIINPLQSKRTKGTGLRKVKTDAADAWHLAEMFYRGDVKPHRTWKESHTELQHITRQHSMYVQVKLNTRALLDQVFPEYEHIFYDLYSTTSLNVLQWCLQGKTEEPEKMILKYVGKSHSIGRIWEKCKQLDMALSRWAKVKRSPPQTRVLEGMVTLLLTCQAQLGQLEKQIEEIATVLPEVDLLKSIPGIGDKLAAIIIAEIGNAGQFKSPKQLVAYAGLDPGVYSSGKFIASSNRVTKRGSKRLRRALYLAVECGFRWGSNCRLKDYYDKKKKEGKPYKVVVIACANKLLHHVYAILSKSQPYQT
jgi:transposase